MRYIDGLGAGSHTQIAYHTCTIDMDMYIYVYVWYFSRIIMLKPTCIKVCPLTMHAFGRACWLVEHAARLPYNCGSPISEVHTATALRKHQETIQQALIWANDLLTFRKQLRNKWAKKDDPSFFVPAWAQALPPKVLKRLSGPLSLDEVDDEGEVQARKTLRESISPGGFAWFVVGVFSGFGGVFLLVVALLHVVLVCWERGGTSTNRHQDAFFTRKVPKDGHHYYTYHVESVQSDNKYSK